MIFLVCKVCSGECDIIGNDRFIKKKIKCTKCGFTNANHIIDRKQPEVVVIRKRADK